MPVYLDCASTTPIDPRVREVVLRHLDEQFGNAGSRTHEYGLQARRGVERARGQVARAAGARRGEVLFTSGATESNNLAILGLAQHGERTGRRHVVSSETEHRAVLEPLEALSRRGFDITLVPCDARGRTEAEVVRAAIREDTFLVSIMHVNNETGVVLPVGEIARALGDHPCFFHVDAAQAFGKLTEELREPRIDLISVSGHKIHAPKGVGALVARRRNGEHLPLAPLTYGGGQERGLRPGTLPVHLIAGLGEAAELAVSEASARTQRCEELRAHLLAGLAPLAPEIHGDPNRCVPHILNLSLPGLDRGVLVEVWADLVAISGGASCTSQTDTCSHVLSAMRLPAARIDGAVRLSWCHSTPWPDVESMVRRVRAALR